MERSRNNSDESGPKGVRGNALPKLLPKTQTTRCKDVNVLRTSPDSKMTSIIRSQSTGTNKANDQISINMMPPELNKTDFNNQETDTQDSHSWKEICA